MALKTKQDYIDLMDAQYKRVEQLRAVITDESRPQSDVNRANRLWIEMTDRHRKTMLEFMVFDIPDDSLLSENPPEHNTDHNL